ncbi:MAG: DUF3775 domain-containing protein [Thiohalophilus sp.]|jgi:ABC-type phosphate/phosphonate transport system substrate-binding protein
MLDMNPETVCFLIDKAHEFHAKEDVVIPEKPNSPTDDWALQVLANHLDDPTYQEIQAAINDLEPDQQATVLALVWLGRGDYDLEEWDEAMQAAVAELSSSSLVPNLMSIPLIADYWQEGLAIHGYRCDE